LGLFGLNIIVAWQARRASLSELAITTQRWIADSNAATTADPEGGPFQRDDDILIDEFYAREKNFTWGYAQSDCP
jgi:hypothetical protein